MNQSIYRFTLDLHSSQSQISIPVTKGDTARAFLINLSDGGSPYAISDGCLAKISIKRPTDTHLEEFCAIENNSAIKYHFSQNKNTAAVDGVHICTVTLYDAAGMILGAPRFTMIVSDKVINSDDIDLSDEDSTAIDAMIVKEAERVANENARLANEVTRENNETERTNAEVLRSAAEESRVAAEEERIGAESSRASNEEKRAKTIDAITTAIGDVIKLQTTKKILVEAINELLREHSTLSDYVGDADIASFETITEAVERIWKLLGCDAENVNGFLGNLENLITNGYTVEGAILHILSEITSLSTQLSGNARSYVVPDFAAFAALLEGNSGVVDADALITGDNVLITEHGVPDFWFEKTTDEERIATAGTYAYEDTEYPLCATKDGAVIGIFHILESDYTVIEEYSKSASAAAEEAKAAAEEANAAAEKAAVDLSGKVDKLENTSGTEVVYAQRTNNEIVHRPVADSPYPTTIPKRTASGAVRTATPTEDDHAVNLKYLTDNYGTHEERISSIEEWARQNSTFTEVEAKTESVSVPKSAYRYAKITEIHGYDSGFVNYEIYYSYANNYPARVVTDTGTVLFEMPSDVMTRLAHFGIRGNYIYFEDGKAYYKQTARADGYYDVEPQEGETEIGSYYDTCKIFSLAEPIITDVSNYITFDGIIDISGVLSITLEMEETEEELYETSKSLAGEDFANVEWNSPSVKIVFETY